MLTVTDKINTGTASGSDGGEEIKNQDKTITENGEYTADDGYTGLGTVTVDVSDIPAVVETLNVTPSTSSQTFTPSTGVDGFNPVNISAVTASIDQNIVASNIKSGVNILSVTGTLQGCDTVTATNNSNSAISNGDKVWFEAEEQTNFTNVGSPNIDYSTMIYTTNGYSDYILIPDFTGRAANETVIPYNVDFQIVLKLKKTTELIFDSNTYPILQTEDWNTYSGNDRYSQVRLSLDFYQGLHTYSSQYGDYQSQVNQFEDSSSFRDLPTDTYFYVRLRSSITETGKFYFGLSKDGVTYNEDAIIISSWYANGLKWLSGKGLCLFGQSGNPAFSLEDCVFKYGNNTWIATKSTTYNIKDSSLFDATGFNEVGTISAIDYGLELSDSRFIETKKSFPTQFNTFEYVIKIRMTSVGSYGRYFLSDTLMYTGNVMGVDGNRKIVWYASGDGTSWNILSGVTGTTTLSYDTIYWIKFVFTGTHYKCFLSTTGRFAGEETTEIDVASSSKIVGGYPVTIGTQQQANNHTGVNYFYGYIDIYQTYIKVDDQVLFSMGMGFNSNLITGVANENIAVSSSGSVKTALQSTQEEQSQQENNNNQNSGGSDVGPTPGDFSEEEW